MTLGLDSWAVDGGTLTGRMARLQLQSASRSGNGVVEPLDLEVTELAVPGTRVRIAPGAAVMLGQEAAFQGSYYAHNVGDGEVDVAATGSAGGRSDLVVLRVEDPTIDGTPWGHDVTTDPIYYFRVIEDVAPNATQVPPGTTGVALARLDIPASTATITQDMITDVRTTANPRNERVIRIQRGVEEADKAGNITDYFENWPDLVWADVPIPTWATQVQVMGFWSNMGFFSADLAGGSGSTDARGEVRLAFGYGTGGGPTDLQSDTSNYNFNLNTSNGQRVSVSVADQLDIPAVMRGQSANLRMQVKGTEGVRGRLAADEYSVFWVDLFFLERPAPEVL